MDPARSRKIKDVVRCNFDASPGPYEAFERTHGLFSRLADRLATMADVGPGHRVLDLGCGTGDSTVLLATRVGPAGIVVGVDSSAAMLAVARRRLQARTAVLLVRADAEDPGCVGRGRFDAVLYNASAFLLPDPGASFRTAASALRPAGSVGCSTLVGIVDEDTGEDLVARYGREAGVRSGRIVPVEALPAALEAAVGPVRVERLRRPSGDQEARQFSAVPAQSAALFPGRPLQERLAGVHALFDIIERHHRPALEWELCVASIPGGPPCP